MKMVPSFAGLAKGGGVFLAPRAGPPERSEGVSNDARPPTLPPFAGRRPSRAAALAPQGDGLGFGVLSAQQSMETKAPIALLTYRC